METATEFLETAVARIDREGPEIVEKIVKTFISSKVDFLLAQKPLVDFSSPCQLLLSASHLRELVTTGLECILNGEDSLRQLERNQSPPVICGKAIRSGDSVYLCSDCSADGTCVLCSSCFQKSAHRTHRYKFRTSGGSGFCDCGDEEAWKQDPWCDEHKPKERCKDMPPLPPGLQARARALFEVCMRYAVKMLTWQGGQGDPLLPFEMKTSVSADCCLSFLCNDEVHSFDDVIGKLCDVVKCSQKTAMDIATEVDRAGRSVIQAGPRKVCQNVKKNVKKGSMKRNKEFQVEVAHVALVAHQTCALEILRWMKTVGDRYALLRCLMCEIALQRPLGSSEGDKSSSDTLLKSILVVDELLWKEAREMCHFVFINSMLLDSQCKMLFSKSFLNFYPTLQDNFLHGHHEHTISVCSVSVQLFTVPSLAKMLVLEHDALKVILDMYCKYLTVEKTRDDCKKICFPQLAFPFISRSQWILLDLSYLLRHGKGCITGGQSEILLRAFQSLLNLLSILHGVDSSKRQCGNHVEYELDWRSAVQLQGRIGCFLSSFVSWCVQDKHVLKECIQMTLKALFKVRNPEKYDNGIVTFDVTKKPCTIHYPLSRLLTSLLVHCGSHGLTFHEVLHSQNEVNPFLYQNIMEEPLRAVVYVSQVNANYWKRNGQAVRNQALSYRHIACRSEMYDKDIMLLQICASIMDLKIFVQTVLSRFGLTEWIKFMYGVDKLRTVSSEKFDLDLQMVEEAFRLLIIICSERFVPGVGQVTLEATATRAVIHRLCLGPCLHSELMKVLPGYAMDSDEEGQAELDSILQSVATFTQTGRSQPRLYEIKADLIGEFSPFYYHYTQQEQFKAMQYLKERVQKENIDAFPLGLPGPLPKFTAPFQATRHLLRCPDVVRLINTVFGRTFCALSSSWSEGQYFSAMFLTGLFLLDEEEYGKTSGRGRPISELGFEDFSCCPGDKKLFTLDSIMKRLRGCPRIDEYVHLFEALFEKFLELNKQDPETVPSPEDAKIDFLKSMTSSPCGGEARRLLQEAEKARNKADASSDEKKAKKTRLCWLPFLRLKKCSKEKAAATEVKAKKVKETKEAAEKRKQEVMANIHKQQEAFKQRHKDELAAAYSMETTATVAPPCPERDGESEEGLVEVASVTVSPGRTSALKERPKEMATCLLCQEEHEIGVAQSQPFVLAACVQKSAVFSHPEELSQSSEKDDSSPLDLLKTFPCSIHISTCGHTMHFDCWQRFIEMKLSERRHRYLFPIESHYLKTDEFLCPLCCCFSNAILPMFPPSVAAVSECIGLGVSSCFSSMKEIAGKCCQLQNDVKSFLQLPRNAFGSEMRSLLVQSLAKKDSGGGGGASSYFPPQKLFHKAIKSSFNPPLNERDVRLPVSIWASCAYTVGALAATIFVKDAQAEASSTMDSLTMRQAECLKSLVRHVNCMAQVCCPSVLREHCLSLLMAVFCPSNPSCKVNLLEMNSFAIVIALLYSIPSLDSGTAQQPVTLDCQEVILQLAFAACLTQAVLTIEQAEDMDAQTQDESEIDADLQKVFSQLRGPVDLMRSVPGLCEKVEERVKPFLMAASLFFHTLTGVPFPNESVEPTSFFSLCRYLSLPASWTSVISFLDPENPAGVGLIAQGWLHALDKAVSPVRIAQPFYQLRKLIELPREYFVIVERAATFNCPNSSGDGSRVPTMCLVCGTILCSQGFCCQTEIDNELCGACTVHSPRCSGGVGIFLLIRECQVILMAGRNRGCFYQPPYFDEYGETDVGLQRGNPLYLCEKSYAKLQELWLKHSVYETIMADIEKHPPLATIKWCQL
eukprot:m.38708 g.38708  ORF g.38708 m.38708 type:complete len:1803 (+) comp32631_c0_seq2:65-5473(+)